MAPDRSLRNPRRRAAKARENNKDLRREQTERDKQIFWLRRKIKGLNRKRRRPNQRRALHRSDPPADRWVQAGGGEAAGEWQGGPELAPMRTVGFG